MPVEEDEWYLITKVETPAGFEHTVIIELCDLPDIPHDDQIRAHLREVADTTDWGILQVSVLHRSKEGNSLTDIDEIMVDFYTDGKPWGGEE